MAYTYEYPHPAVTVDIVVFTVRRRALSVLLVRRGAEPFEGRWALPGGFVEIDEDLEHAARRELEEETGVTPARLEQLRAYGEPGRDPRERVISIAHVALLPESELGVEAASDAAEAALFPVDELPASAGDDGRILAFDHDRILADARKRLAREAADPLVALELVDETFTLPELAAVLECLSGRPTDRRNFRRLLLRSERIEATGEERVSGARRPAKLYRKLDA